MSCRALLIAAVVVLATACGQTPGGDDDVDPDAMTTAMHGLRLVFETKPEVPGDVGGDNDARVDTASFQLRNLRAIGDAAPGDERTRVDALTIAWAGETVPSPVVFSMAPLGLYSQVSLEIVAYRITGSVEVIDTTYPFEIDDTPPVPIPLTTSLQDVMVNAGEVTTVTLHVRVGEPVNEFKWASEPPNGDGVISVDEDTDDIDEVRDELGDLIRQADD